MTHWERPWCWEGLGAGGEGDDRGWDGWMASLTRWMWVWVNSGSWWWTGRPGVLQFMGLQRVGNDWATELKNYDRGKKKTKNPQTKKHPKWQQETVLKSISTTADPLKSQEIRGTHTLLVKNLSITLQLTLRICSPTSVDSTNKGDPINHRSPSTALGRC